jgi:hypothetical protein
MAADDSTNVLIWRGAAAQQATVLIKRHKTWRLKGMLTKELPPSVRSIIAASLAKLPRSMLFVSELTQKPFNSEASFVAWACRAFQAVFGKRVSMNNARHAFISALDVSKMSTASLEALAKEMGHSLAAQRAYFRLDNASLATAAADGELDLPLRPTAQSQRE